MDFESFWPFYLAQHRHPVNRWLHVVGTTVSLTGMAWLLVMGFWPYMGLAVVVGYAFAWAGHYGVEKNRPATFGAPLYSLRADLRMWGLACTGRLRAELGRQGIRS